jgi:uncharacterized protein YbaP (TraB family)
LPRTPRDDMEDRMKKLLSVLSAVGLLFAPVLTFAKAPTSTSASPALWMVKDVDTTIYLFGSVHMMKPGVVWFDDEVKAAFDRSDTLVLEMVEPSREDMAKLIGKLAVATSGPPLSQKLDPDPRTRYVAAMKDAGLPLAVFEQYQPWMAGVTLAVVPLSKLGYQSDAGVEQVLTSAARQAGKPIQGLETAEQQLGYFAGLPEAQQIAFLNETVNDLPKAEDEFAALTRAWEAGKPRELAKQMNDSMEATPELAQVLLYGRNANWARWIDERLQQPGTVFIAVGAGHLAGPKSVIDQLKGMGIRTKRVGKHYFHLK